MLQELIKCVKEDNDRIAGRRPFPGYRKPVPKPKDKTDDENRSPATMISATSGSEASAGTTDIPGTPYTDETTNGDANITDPTVAQSSDEHSDILSHLNTEPKKRGVKPGTKRGEFNKDGTPGKIAGVHAGTRRNQYKMTALSDRNLVQSQDVKQ